MDRIFDAHFNDILEGVESKRQCVGVNPLHHHVFESQSGLLVVKGGTSIQDVPEGLSDCDVGLESDAAVLVVTVLDHPTRELQHFGAPWFSLGRCRVTVVQPNPLLEILAWHAILGEDDHGLAIPMSLEKC